MAIDLSMAEIAASCYTYWGGPEEDVMPLSLFLRIGRDCDQQLCNDLNLSGQNFALKTVPITVDGGTDTYLIPVAPSEFGRVEFVEVELLNGQGRRRVRVTDLRDQDSLSGTQVPRSGPTLLTNVRRVEEVSIYRDELGNPRMRVVPFPADARTYVLYFTPGAVQFTALSLVPNSLRAAPMFFSLLVAYIVRDGAVYLEPFKTPSQIAGIIAVQERRLNDPRHGLLVQWERHLGNDNEETDGFVDGVDLGEQTGRWGLY